MTSANGSTAHAHTHAYAVTAEGTIAFACTRVAMVVSKVVSTGDAGQRLHKGMRLPGHSTCAYLLLTPQAPSPGCSASVPVMTRPIIA